MAEAKEEISIDQMKEKDLDEVMEIEEVSFPSPWTRNQFARELESGPVRDRALNQPSPPSHFLVAKREGKVVGYAGFWLVAGEAHIGNLAVHPHFRRGKIGERLLLAMLELAAAKGAKRISLEVRVRNKPAQNLYQKFGFTKVATYPRYYVLTQEDALIMCLDLPPQPKE